MPKQFQKALVDFVNISADYDSVNPSTKAVMYNLYVASVLPKDLTGFVEVAYAIRHHCLPDPESIPVSLYFIFLHGRNTCTTFRHISYNQELMIDLSSVINTVSGS